MASFPLNVGKTENNGIANSQMWQMGNWVRETLSIRLKALLQLRSCPLSVILGGAALQEAQRKLLIWSRSTIRAGCYLDDLVPAKPAVWSLSKQHHCVLILAQSLQDWERRWGQLHKSLVKINTYMQEVPQGSQPKTELHAAVPALFWKHFWEKRASGTTIWKSTDAMIRLFWEHLQTDPVHIVPGLSLYTAEQSGTLAGFIRTEKAWFIPAKSPKHIIQWFFSGQD